MKEQFRAALSHILEVCTSKVDCLRLLENFSNNDTNDILSVIVLIS